LAGLALHDLDIIDLGVLPTPVIYWAKSELSARACAAITASHNPPGWNGLKIMNGEWPPTPEEIRVLGDESDGDDLFTRKRRGKIDSWNSCVETYIERLITSFSGRGVGVLSVVLDPGNGCQAGIASRVFSNLGAKVNALHDRRDGTFPERHPDSAIPEHLRKLRDSVVEHGADLGVAFDGDGDRLSVVDDQGRVLGAERLGMVLLEGPLRPGPNVPVIIDLKCSMRLERLAREFGGVPERSKSGHAFMKRMVMERAAVVGVELSGHIFLGSLGGRDDPLHTALLLCVHLVNLGQPLSVIVDKLPAMYMTEDVRVPMDAEDMDRILATCMAGLPGARVETLDGVRLLWEEGWLLVRRSITEPKVTIRLEGERIEDLQRIADRFLRVFPELGPHLEPAIRKVTRGPTCG
jgi:phosphomannomutase/phosphoglucomutase